MKYIFLIILFVLVIVGCSQIENDTPSKPIISEQKTEDQNREKTNTLKDETDEEEISSITLRYPKLNQTARYNLEYVPNEIRGEVAEKLIAGIISFEHYKFESAIKTFDQVIALDKLNEPAFYYRGISKFNMGDYEESLADFDNVLKLNPNRLEVYLFKADIKAQISDLNEAIGEINKLISINPNITLAYLYRADYYYELENYQLAEKDYTKVINLDKKNAKAYAYRGLIKKKIYEDSINAIKDFDQSLKYKESVLAYTYRATSKSALRDFDYAIQDLTLAIKYNPDAIDPYLIRAAINAFEIGDLDPALEDLNKAIELNSSEPLIYDLRARVKESMGDIDGADEDYDKIAKLAPNFYEYYELTPFWK